MPPKATTPADRRTGFWNRERETATAFRGGWLHTGDLAYRDGQGFIYIVDRKKEMIISGGFNVYPREVEDVMSTHPDVAQVAVIGVPDDYWGEVPKAFVVLKPDVHGTPDEIIAFCRDHIAHFKAPKYVEIGDLPKTSTGKIQKFVLRDKEWAGKDKRIN